MSAFIILTSSYQRRQKRFNIGHIIEYVAADKLRSLSGDSVQYTELCMTGDNSDSFNLVYETPEEIDALIEAAQSGRIK